jgi:hypothetical protein
VDKRPGTYAPTHIGTCSENHKQFQYLERSLDLAAAAMCLQFWSRGSHSSPDTGSPVRPVQPDGRSQWDQLEANLKRLDALGYPQFIERVHQDLFSLLDSILSTKEPYRRLLQYRGEQAQLLVNALQSVSSPFHIRSSPKLISLELICVHPSVDGDKKREFMQVLLQLSKCAKVIPRSFNLAGVEMGEVMIETGSVDILRGFYGGRKVCLKKY